MADLLSIENLIALLTLTGLEIVLGIDNIVFIAILTGKLDPSLRARARQVGLLAAMFMRIGLLLGISLIMRLTRPLFSLWAGGHEFSGKDLVILAGGLFLLAKATYEIHDKLEGAPHEVTGRAAKSFAAAIVQIMLVDLIFSIDSVVTAVGMAQRIEVMIAAVVVSVGVMMLAAGAVSGFIERHPTFKILGLSFLLLIGVMLVAESCGAHVSKGYIYFAMGFSLFVEALNIRFRRVSSPTNAHADATRTP